jgi:hypothetical protein
MKQSGRSIFLWSLGMFALSAVVLWCLIDPWCPNASETLHRLKWDQLLQVAREAPEHSLVVMLGSSRTDAAFQAQRVDALPAGDGRPLRGFNFGVPAAGPIHQYLYLREMLDHGIKPRLVLIEYLRPLLSQPHRGLISEEGLTSPAWLSGHELGRVAPYFSDRWGLLSTWLEARVAPWYAHRLALHGWARIEVGQISPLPPAASCYDTRGWRFPDKLTAADAAALKADTRHYIPSLARFRLGTGPAQAMRDLLDRCRHEQVPVVLVVIPESAEFQSWYSNEALTTTDHFLEELRTTYGVPVIDGRRWLAEEDFTDGHHVGESGATAFTTRLLDELRDTLRVP